MQVLGTLWPHVSIWINEHSAIIQRQVQKEINKSLLTYMNAELEIEKVNLGNIVPYVTYLSYQSHPQVHIDARIR